MDLYQIGKFFALIGFIYRLIDSMITYTKFEIVFNIQEGPVDDEIPSISLCINSFEEFLKIKKEKEENETIGEYKYRAIKCEIRTTNGTIRECDPEVNIVESVTLCL